MNILDYVKVSFSSALDAIINTKIYYRDNNITILQSGIILLLPQVTAYLLQYNEQFGIKLRVQLSNYPLLLFIFLVVLVFVMVEPAVTEKSAEVISRIALLSIHLFAFALSLNLIYAVVIPLFGQNPDPLGTQISNLFANRQLTESTFAMCYGAPFLILAVILVFLNSYYLYPAGQLKSVFKLRLFWESFAVAIALAFYQYAVFILIGKTAA